MLIKRCAFVDLTKTTMVLDTASSGGDVGKLHLVLEPFGFFVFIFPVSFLHCSDSHFLLAVLGVFCRFAKSSPFAMTQNLSQKQFHAVK